MFIINHYDYFSWIFFPRNFIRNNRHSQHPKITKTEFEWYIICLSYSKDYLRTIKKILLLKEYTYNTNSTTSSYLSSTTNNNSSMFNRQAVRKNGVAGLNRQRKVGYQFHRVGSRRTFRRNESQMTDLWRISVFTNAMQRSSRNSAWKIAATFWTSSFFHMFQVFCIFCINSVVPPNEPSMI